MNGFRVAFLGIAALAAPAVAQQGPIPMPADNKLVVFPYDANDTYTVLTVPGAVTNIQLHTDEEVEAFAIGDSVQWSVAKSKNHVFVKPLRPGIFTSATLVTNQRAYQITLRSSPDGGKWYQRVTWSYPDLLLFRELQRQAADADTARKKDSLVADSAVPVENLNFNYEVSGDAEFRPSQVFDDGTFTYVRFGRKVQDLPALFVQLEDNRHALVNYTVDKEILKVQRVFRHAVLKLGSQEVTIRNLSDRPMTSVSSSWRP